MIFGRHLDDRRADCRFGFEAVSMPRLIDQQSGQLGFPLVGCKVPQVDSLELYRPALVNDSQGPLVSDLNRGA